MSNININNSIYNSNLINLKNKTKNLEDKIESSKTTEDKEKLMKASKDFESVFVNMMLKQMRSTVQDGGLIEKSTGREMFESMYDEEISKSISEKGDGIGLAKLIYENMKNRL